MLDRQAQLSIIKSALAGYSGKKIQSSYYTMICCPYHEDSTPSGQIYHGDATKVLGYYKCLGCGARRTWNQLAKDMGWQTFSGVKPEDRFASAVSELTADADDNSAEFELSDLPRNKFWRTFSTNYLAKIGCQLGTYPSGRRFVYLPVIVGGRERGYIRAALRKRPDAPSYLNKKGNWSKKYGLFPFDTAIKLMRKLDSRTVVLVEGPRDALRLLSHRIPAMSILGTQTWTSNKARLLELHGVRRCLLMFDGDPAGIKASERIEPDVAELMKVHDLQLWDMPGSPYRKWKNLEEQQRKETKGELWDPGNCPIKVLNKIRHDYFSR